MADTASGKVASLGRTGGVWAQLRVEAMQAAAEEPLLASFLHATILHHESVGDALSYKKP
jgi:serine O-acetyltransferase